MFSYVFFASGNLLTLRRTSSGLPKTAGTLLLKILEPVWILIPGQARISLAQDAKRELADSAIGRDVACPHSGCGHALTDFAKKSSTCMYILVSATFITFRFTSL